MSDQDVFTGGPAHADNYRHWELVRDLSGGHVAMVENRSRWILRARDESAEEYRQRVEGAAIVNAFIRACKRSTNRVFVRDVEVSGIEEDSTLSWMTTLLANIDNEGSTLTQFASERHYTAARYGMASWLVEHTEPGAGIGRPYVWPIDPLDLIDAVEDDDGRLIDIRILGKRERRDPNRPWIFTVERTCRRYFVADGSVFVELYVEGDRDKKQSDVPVFGPVQLLSATQAPITQIPLVTAYFNKVGPMRARSPFEDLAYLTLRHYQSYTEQAWQLKSARIPVLGLFGFEDSSDPDAPGPTGTGEEIQINRRSIIQSRNADARAEYVETQGRSLEQGWHDIKMLGEQMEKHGDEPSVHRTGVQSATGAFLEDLSAQGAMAMWTRTGEMAMRETLRLMAMWRGIELPESVSVQIREEKPLQPADDRKQGRLGEMYDRGALTKRTYLMEMQKAGAVSEAVDPDAEIAAAEAESAQAALVMGRMEGEVGIGFDDSEDEDNG